MEVKTIFRTFNLDNISPTIDRIREQIDIKLFNKANKKNPSLIKFIESYIEECSRIKKPKGSCNPIKLIVGNCILKIFGFPFF